MIIHDLEHCVASGIEKIAYTREPPLIKYNESTTELFCYSLDLRKLLYYCQSLERANRDLTRNLQVLQETPEKIIHDAVTQYLIKSKTSEEI